MRHDHFGDEETEAQRQFLKLALGQIVSIRGGFLNLSLNSKFMIFLNFTQILADSWKH